ncbi:MAG: antibiotic biosynthesis monooxygenase [Actinomycetota bacterium]
MSVVKINAVSVPEGMGADFMDRFAKRVGSVENQPGFEEFLLLEPTDDNDRFFVFTRWASEEAFDAWINSNDFAAAHAHVAEEAAQVTEHGHGEFDGEASEARSGHGEHAPGGHGHGGHGGPVGVSAELLAFDVIERVTGSS